MSRRPRRPAPRPAAVDDARVLAAIDDALSRLPAMECRGKCQEACTAIDMSDAEHRRIVVRSGIDIPRARRGGALLRALAGDGPPPCPALTMLGTCAVQTIKPTVCVLWGMVESMSCAYGCRPESGFVDERTGMAVLMVSESAGTGRLLTFEEAYERCAYLDDPAVLHAWRNDMAAGSNPYSDVIREATRAQLGAAMAGWRKRHAGEMAS